MKKITMTGREINSTADGLQNNRGSYSGLNLALAVAKNRRVLAEQVKDFVDALPKSEIFNKFVEARRECVGKHGGQILANGAVNFPDASAMRAWLDDFGPKPAEVIEHEKKILEISNEWERKAFELELVTVKQEDLPKGINDDALTFLLPFLE